MRFYGLFGLSTFPHTIYIHKKVDNNKYPQYVDKMWITTFFSIKSILSFIHILYGQLFLLKNYPQSYTTNNVDNFLYTQVICK